jgi:hypothetical protein
MADKPLSGTPAADTPAVTSNDRRLYATMDPVPAIPDYADASQIPAHLVEAGAAALDGEIVSSSADVARLVLSGALASQALVPLPPPDDVDEEGVAYWGDVAIGSFVASRPPTDDPADTGDGVDLGGVLRFNRLQATQAFELAGWVLAATLHAQPAPLTTPHHSRGHTCSREATASDSGELMSVRVRDRSAEGPWGSGRVYPRVRDVRISATCRVCGGPRGKPRNNNCYDDGERYAVDIWDNACGHVDTYTAVLAEAREIADRATRPEEQP